MSRILLKDGCVLSLDRRVGNFHRADVLIEDTRIAEVGPDLRARGAEVIDASDCIVMPGFVDTHRHLRESLFRGFGTTPGPTVLHSRHYGPEDVYAATLVGLLGAVEGGITTVADWNEPADDAQLEAALQAHADAGVRTVLVHAEGDRWNQDLAGRQDADRLRLLTYAGGVNTAGDPDTGSGAFAHARDLGLRVHAHVMNSRWAGLGPLLGEDVTLIHGSGLGAADLDALAASAASISLTPSSDMAGGVLPLEIQQLVDRGIRPGLGVDRELVAPGDLFAQMRAAISLQHARHFDLKLAGKAGLPRLLTTREVIRYATSDGARAIGLGTATGTLAPGKQADIVLLRADRPNIFPINDPIGAVVWGMDTSNVDWVFVAGSALMSNGELEADLDRTRDLAGDARRRVAEAAGLLTPSRATG